MDAPAPAVDGGRLALDSQVTMNRRLWIGVLTAVALLGQTVAPARASSQAATETATAAEQPCHDEMPAPAHDPASNDCCCDDEGCATLCAAFGAALPALFTELPKGWPAATAIAPRASAAAPAHRLTPLRPPITASA